MINILESARRFPLTLTLSPGGRGNERREVPPSPPRGEGRGEGVGASRLLVATALLASLCSTAHAADLRVIPLRSVDNQGGQLELRGQAGQLQFRVPVEAGAKVQDARLRLVYQTTDAVVAERSRMWVYLNQQSIAQLPLAGDDEALRADIVLPPELLTPGQNVLSLWAQQENRQGCDAGSSAALWTRLDPQNSFLALETIGPDREPTLSDLADPASFIGAGAERIEILTPGDRNEAVLKAGALVAQGFALRLPDTGIAVRHRTAAPTLAGDLSPARTGDRGKVLVGRAAALRGLIADLPEIAGPYIGLRDLPGGGRVLVVSGRNDREVQSAAATFANPAARLPAARDWTVDAVPLPVEKRRAVQEPGDTYRFADLRATSGGISNGTEPRTGLEINLPADTLPAGGRKFLLELDYAYAPNLAPNSVVNVLVNGRYASMIALNDKLGAMMRGQRVLLPIDMLRPGMNTIAFEPMIGSDPAVGCLVRPGGGKSVAISGDSRITIPEMARVASLPDLQLFASGGFPYVGGAQNREFTVMLTSTDDGTIGGALTLLAKLAQSAGHPVANFAVGKRLEAVQGTAQGDVLMIGPIQSLDSRFTAALPMAARTVRDALNPASALFDPGPLFASPAVPPAQAPAPAIMKAGVAEIEMTKIEVIKRGMAWTSELSRDFRQALWPSRYADDTATNLAAVDEGSAMMAAFESPLKPQTTVTLITAATEEGVEAGIATLVRPALWDRLSGGTVAWNPGSMAMQAWPAETAYRLGEVPDAWHQRVLFVNALFARNPVGWALLALMGLLSLTWVTHLALGKREGN